MKTIGRKNCCKNLGFEHLSVFTLTSFSDIIAWLALAVLTSGLLNPQPGCGPFQPLGIKSSQLHYKYKLLCLRSLFHLYLTFSLSPYKPDPSGHQQCDDFVCTFLTITLHESLPEIILNPWNSQQVRDSLLNMLHRRFE